MSAENLAEISAPEEPGWSGTAVSGFILSLIGVIVPFGSLAAILVSGLGLAFTSNNKKRGRALAGWGLALGIANAGLGALIGGTAGWQATQDFVTNTSEDSYSAEAPSNRYIKIPDGEYRCSSSDVSSDVFVIVRGGKARSVELVSGSSNTDLSVLNFSQTGDYEFTVSASGDGGSSFLGAFKCSV